MYNRKITISLLLLLLSLKADDNNITNIINQGTPTIKEMLTEVSIQKRYEKNRTLLHYAVEARDFNAVSFLVEQKIILSSQGGAYNNTALQDAIFLGYLKIARYLIKKGTPPNLKNRYGQTALHIASDRQYVGIVKLLLAYGAEKTILDNNGNTPYDFIPKHSLSNRKLKKLLQPKFEESYINIITIDKKSKIQNSHIGIQINIKK